MQTIVYCIHEFCRKYKIANSTFYQEVRLGRLHTIRYRAKQFVTDQEAERWNSQRKKRRSSEVVAEEKKQPDVIRRTYLVSGFFKRFLGK